MIKNKKGIQSTFIEEKQLKNVDEPMRVYSVEVEEGFDDKEQTNYASTKQPKSFLSRQMLLGLIAVLVVVLVISIFFNPLGEGETTGKTGQSDHPKPEQSDQGYRLKLTTGFRSKVTTLFRSILTTP